MTLIWPPVIPRQSASAPTLSQARRSRREAGVMGSNAMTRQAVTSDDEFGKQGQEVSAVQTHRDGP